MRSLVGRAVAFHWQARTPASPIRGALRLISVGNVLATASSSQGEPSSPTCQQLTLCGGCWWLVIGEPIKIFAINCKLFAYKSAHFSVGNTQLVHHVAKLKQMAKL